MNVLLFYPTELRSAALFLRGRGGEQFAETLPWKEFCILFFDKYFSNVDLGAYKREYHNIRQQDDEELSKFNDRFYRLIGFLGSSVGSPEEQAEKYQWAVCDRIRRVIIHSTFTNVAEAVKAAKKVDMERNEFLKTSDSKKRGRDGQHVQSGSQLSSQGSVQNNNDRRIQGNQTSGGQAKSWQGKSKKHGSNKAYQSPIPAQPLNQRGNSNLVLTPICSQCGNRHPGPCRRASGACFRCGQIGHLVKDCPKPANTQEGNNKDAIVPRTTGGRVFTLTTGEAANTPG
ncbi:hypothetical protein E3N88_32342 [Mikania micrantha]|uniref:CCHC-type domain-containing protein n=1 Tax=Mikania micrantha TaxID=192012 RepID=A0A5N6M8X9_9ASTR|nr:hypothetical protein E3N88_32342 [Mikania micrantha]